jgi:hypothetical protein
MHLYSPSKKQFDPDTGEPIAPMMVRDRKKAICDYSGEEIDIYDNIEEIPLYSISIKYDNSCEPQWYEDMHELQRELGIEFDYGCFSQFMESPYHFRHTEEYGCSDVTLDMMKQWITIKKFKKSDDPLHRCGTIGGVLMHTRLETLKRLLKEKKYTLEQLGLEIE